MGQVDKLGDDKDIHNLIITDLIHNLYDFDNIQDLGNKIHEYFELFIKDTYMTFVLIEPESEYIPKKPLYRSPNLSEFFGKKDELIDTKFHKIPIKETQLLDKLLNENKSIYIPHIYENNDFPEWELDELKKLNSNSLYFSPFIIGEKNYGYLVLGRLLEQENLDLSSKDRKLIDELTRIISPYIKSYSVFSQLSLMDQQKRIIFEKAFDIIFSINQEGIILNINPVIESIISITPEEVIGKNISNIYEKIKLPPENYLTNYNFENFYNSNEVITREFEIIDKDGNMRIFETKSWINKNENHEYIAHSISRDITHQKQRIEEELKLQKLTSLGILAGGIAHDFNNNLSVIQGNVSFLKLILEEGRDISDTELLNILNEIEASVKSSSLLTKQLLTFSKGGTPLKEIIDFIPFVNQMVKKYLEKTGIEINVESHIDERLVKIDPGMIEQVFKNVIENSIEALNCTDNSKIKITIDLVENKSQTANKNGKLEVEIMDNGIGIPENSINAIYDPFFTTKDQAQGLGLSTALSIMHKHNGDIRVESKFKEFTKVYLYFPITEEEIKKDLEEDNVLDNLTILIMDDKKEIITTLNRILEFVGCTVISTYHGDEVLEIVESNPDIDLAILDLTIKNGKGGNDIIDKLNRISPGMKKIVMSGYSSDRILANYDEFGFDGFLPKPITKEVLISTIKEIIS